MVPVATDERLQLMQLMVTEHLDQRVQVSLVSDMLCFFDEAQLSDMINEMLQDSTGSDSLLVLRRLLQFGQFMQPHEAPPETTLPTKLASPSVPPGPQRARPAQVAFKLFKQLDEEEREWMLDAMIDELSEEERQKLAVGDVSFMAQQARPDRTTSPIAAPGCAP